ncbi:MAG: AMP-binding protein, partial [Patulibacter minatonensis]
MTQSLGTGTTTIAALLPRAAELYGDRSATSIKRDGTWVQQSYTELLDESTAIGLGLIGLGVAAGDRVCILGNTSRPWTVADFGATRAGTIVVPIYQTNSPKECEWVVSDSGATAIFVEDAEQAAKIAAIRDQVPALQHVIVWNGDAAEGTVTLDELIAKGEGVDPSELQARTDAVRPEDPFTIIYTSGTTGPPKGCVLSHGNYRAIVDSSIESGLVEDGESTEDEILYCFLPLAHSFARLMQLAVIDAGAVLAYFGGDTTQVIAEIQEVKPSVLPSVPRIFEKIFTIALQMAGAETVQKATDVGLKVQALKAAGQEVPAELQAGYDELEGRLFGLVRGLFGGRLRRAITGAAPLGIDIISFFTACGVPLMQGYGMTETATATSCCTPEHNKLGSVGRPLPGVEAKLGEDGELLIRGANVFQGYWHNEAATAETITDGWLHTGDLATIDADGFIDIVGRKKDIIITAGGKKPHAREHRGRPQAQPDHLPGGDARRPPPVPGGSDHARSRDRAGLGRAERPPDRPRRALRGARADRRGATRARRGQRPLRAGRADQEVRGAPARLLAGDGRADADAEGQAQRGERDVRRRARRALRLAACEGRRARLHPRRSRASWRGAGARRRAERGPTSAAVGSVTTVRALRPSAPRRCRRSRRRARRARRRPPRWPRRRPACSRSSARSRARRACTSARPRRTPCSLRAAPPPSASPRRSPSSSPPSTALLEDSPTAVLTTELRIDGEIDENGVLDGDLIVRGAGDPSLTLTNVAVLAAAAKRAGITP